MKKKISLKDAYSFENFIATQEITSHPDFSDSYIIKIKRNKKKLIVQYVVNYIELFMIATLNELGIYLLARNKYIWNLK